ncbi:MAG: hypothetical protein ACFHU9_02625 [Fluviicola sp.]
MGIDNDNGPIDILDEDLKKLPEDHAGQVVVKMLCYFTITGSIFIVLVTFDLNKYFEDENDLTLVYLAGLISCIMSAIAAVIMLMRRLIGYYIYLASNAIYTVVSIWFLLKVTNFEISFLAAMLLLTFLAIPAAFTIAYSYYKRIFIIRETYGRR